MFLRYLLLSLLLPLLTFSQEPLGNEWINFEQNYNKIQIAEDGLYQLGYQDLQNLGLEPSSIDPQLLKMFLMGHEKAIIVEGAGDGSFDMGDKIIFYAEENKGELDSLVYRPLGARMNKYQSLFSDYASYF
jgi:hypothetical protein